MNGQSKETISPLRYTIAVICYLGFLFQMVLAMKIIVIDKDFAILALCLLFSVLFAAGFAVAGNQIVQVFCAKILFAILSACSAVATVLTLCFFGFAIAPSIGLGIFVGTIATLIPVSVIVSSRQASDS